ncbi:MAG: hypothetical protein ACR2NP_18885, partial [Pirellulaceae bacterium]
MINVAQLPESWTIKMTKQKHASCQSVIGHLKPGEPRHGHAPLTRDGIVTLTTARAQALTDSESSSDTPKKSPFGLRFGHWLQFLGFGLIILIVVVIFGRAIAGHINDIESWIQSISPWGILVFIGLVALLTSLLVPSTLLSIAAGSLFGLVGGLSVV